MQCYTYMPNVVLHIFMVHIQIEFLKYLLSSLCPLLGPVWGYHACNVLNYYQGLIPLEKLLDSFNKRIESRGRHSDVQHTPIAPIN